MIITGTECTLYSNITASATTILASGYIRKVQERITLMTNNYFVSDEINLCTSVRFNATSRSIISDGNKWEDYGFKVGDDIFIYGSRRNDSYVTIESISDETIILTSACSVVDEYYNNSSGNAITFFLTQWPFAIKMIAAKMVAYDYDVRDKISANVKSHSLGPFSETFTDGKEDEFGYPKKLTEDLTDYRIARCF